MLCVKVKFQNLTCNLAETWLKANTVRGRVPLDITPISDDHRCYRRSRLRAGPSGEAALEQPSTQTFPWVIHRGPGPSLQQEHGPRLGARALVSITEFDGRQIRQPWIKRHGSCGWGLGWVSRKRYRGQCSRIHDRPSARAALEMVVDEFHSGG